MTPYTIDDLETEFRAASIVGDRLRLDSLAVEFDALEQAARHTVTLHQAALWYAQQGLRVFPLTPGTKIPFKGSNGCHGASANLDVVDGWWADDPDANIGIATGHLVDVIDIDGPDGVGSLLQLLDDLPPVLGKVSTPRPGGTHLYVRAVPGRGNKAGLLPHIDYRGTGGYVVAPPSVNEQGIYAWRTPLDVAALSMVGAA